MVNTLKINDKKWLVRQSAQQNQVIAKAVELAMHHIFIIDCSGSMSGALPSIRKDLNNKLSTMLKVSDSLTVIWFSSRGEYGVVLEDYKINGSVNIEKARELVNKNLYPRGCTAFKDSFVETMNIVKRVNAVNKDMLHSLFFITDGYDNCYPRPEILAVIRELKHVINSATIVEYGWYCDKKFLNDITLEFGGTHKFSKDFQDFEPMVSSQLVCGKTERRKEITLEHPTDAEFVVTAANGEISIYRIENGKVTMPAGDDTAFYYLTSSHPAQVMLLTESSYSGNDAKLFLPGMYAMMSACSKMSDYDAVSELLGCTGDARLILKKANTFGTQKINELEKDFESCATNEAMRYTSGYNPNLEPKEDAYCVFDMIEDLMSDDDNKFYPRHEAFSYERTTKKTINASSTVTNKDKKKIDEAVATGDASAILKAATEIQDEKSKELEFLFEPESPGCPMSYFVWNSERANLSVMCTFTGIVALPKNKFGIPESFQTSIIRNYTIIKDGIIHTYKLPISFAEQTFKKLHAQGLLQGEAWEQGKIYVLDFSELPVINRLMTKEKPSASKLALMVHSLTKTQAYCAVMNYYKKLHKASESKGFAEMYGADGAAWLAERGLMPYGYAPKKVTESTGEEQNVSAFVINMLKRSLPSGSKEISKVIDKIKAGTALTPREAWFRPAIEEYNTFVKLSANLKQEVLLEWIYVNYVKADAERRSMISEVAKIKFLIIVGKLWFSEFKSRAEKTLTLKIDGEDVMFEFDDSEKTIKL